MPAITSVTSPIDEIPHHEMRRPSALGEPLWDIAALYPAQGDWSEADYLGLQTRRLVEFSDGFLEVLPMPKLSHQRIVAWLYERLNGFVRPRGLGEALFAPVPVRLWPRTWREPDVFFLTKARAKRLGDYPDGVDLAIEIVSDGPDARRRDLETKRVEYAAAGIAEYWIVDPELREITVLALDGSTYRVHGVFRGDDEATSALLAGFAVRVSEVFAAGEQPVAE